MPTTRSRCLLCPSETYTPWQPLPLRLWLRESMIGAPGRTAALSRITSPCRHSRLRIRPTSPALMSAPRTLRVKNRASFRLFTARAKARHARVRAFPYLSRPQIHQHELAGVRILHAHHGFAFVVAHSHAERCFGYVDDFDRLPRVIRLLPDHDTALC